MPWLRSRAFRRLAALTWRNDDRHNHGAMASELTRLADPPRLRTLNLSGNRIDAEQLVRLVAAPVLSAVEELDLSDNNLGPEGAMVLAAARLPHLRSLRLSQTWPRDDGIRALLGADFFPGLRRLELAGQQPPARDRGAARRQPRDRRPPRVGPVQQPLATTERPRPCWPARTLGKPDHSEPDRESAHPRGRRPTAGSDSATGC